MGQLNLRVLIEAVDRATRPLRGISRGIQALVRPAKIAGLAVVSLGRDLRNMALMGAAAVTAVGFSLYRMTQAAVDAGDAALLASQKTGVQIESYQRLAYAARMAGVETSGFDDSLKFLNLSIDAAGRGSKTDARAFAQLGVTIKDVHGQVKPTERLMFEVAERFKTLPDGAQKTAIAMALFGRSGVDLIPMLNEGGEKMREWGDEAQRAGLIMSEQTARNADELNDSLDSLKGGIAGLSVSIVSGLLPDLIKAVAWLRKMIDANRPEIVRQLQKALKDVAAATPGVVRGCMAIIAVLGDIARVVGPLVRAIGGFGTVLDIMAALLIGRVAVAIWMATKAVLGLNVAMWANPIGLVIAGLAALTFAGWMLYRNWNNIVAGLKAIWGLYLRYCDSVWSKMKAAFKAAMGALWQLLPPWLRVIFRGAAFTLRVVGQGLGVGGPGGGAPRGPAGPSPVVRSRVAQVGGEVRIGLDRGGQPVIRSIRSNNPAVPITATTYRGSVVGGD